MYFMCISPTWHPAQMGGMYSFVYVHVYAEGEGVIFINWWCIFYYMCSPFKLLSLFRDGQVYETWKSGSCTGWTLFWP